MSEASGDDPGGPDGPGGPDRPPRAAVGGQEMRFEIVATILLSVAALATAWAGYQASLWDGIQASHYGRASAYRVQAAEADTDADQERLGDLSVVEGYIDASAAGDQALAAFYRGRAREELAPAFEAWISLDPFTNPDAPRSPLSMDEYVLDEDVESRDLTARAEAEFAEGEEANDTSDIYTLATLILAAALFFTAISERFSYVPARVTLLAMGLLALVGGVVISVGQPVTSG
jgi:hypothetical protein